jgi:error-prone DNA polymerase
MPELSRKEEAQRAARRRGTGNVLRLPVPARANAPQPRAPDVPAYAELHALTHFSFLRATASPEELVRRAWELGYSALAITDECSVSGAVQAWRALADLREEQHQAASPAHGHDASGTLRLIFGSEFSFQGQGTLVVLARDFTGWGDLCAFISACRRAAPKGRYVLPPLAEALAALARCERLWLPERKERAAAPPIKKRARMRQAAGTMLVASAGPCGAAVDHGAVFVFPAPEITAARIPLLVELHARLDDALWLAHLRAVAAASGCPLVAAGGVLTGVRRDKRLHDVMTAVRLGRTVAECGLALQASGERHLRPRERLARIYPADMLVATLQVAARCRFRLDEVRYVYPRESVLPGLTPMQTLTHLTREGAARRFPQGVPPRIQAFIDKELALIAECRYEMFFLTVHDIVREARRLGILCQGRGSAANSVVCYCLGITAADPRLSHPLLERFISKARRNEPPDIDVDFEHERREEIIQYIYRKYGRERAALAASVITYRTRSALRDVGAALGLNERLVDAVANDHHGFEDGKGARGVAEKAAALSLGVAPALIHLWLELARQLRGHPRHLSQHVGGFVLTQTPLVRLVPVEPAAMQGRQVIQWDKDDLEALGWLKVDILALGMLTAVRRCLDLASGWRGRPLTRADIAQEDPATYAMIQHADTVGVFQIESRAQMSMLPRLRPTEFYDLVVQVAIVRPGPVTGGMVHPYLKARERGRQGLAIEYQRSRFDVPGRPPRLARALERTLGIPIFQEQVMELSMLAAGFSPSDADRLRRAMATWKKKGGLEPFREKLLFGMSANGYSEEFAERLFEQIKGFGDYGFPESHAYSFALIAYESAWLKCHHPEAYLAALLNSQPMGFYGPSQLVQDARRHGVVVLPVDVGASDWDCTLERDPSASDAGGLRAPLRLRLDDGKARRTSGSGDKARPVDPLAFASARNALPDAKPAVRLGLRMVQGLAETAAARIATARAAAPFASVEDLALRAGLDTKALGQLAAADALASLAGHRRQQVWQGAALKKAPGLLRHAPVAESEVRFDAAPEGEEIVHDYAALGLTLRRHPLALLRARLARSYIRTAGELHATPGGQAARACGIVIGRQRPGTAKGTIFVTLEDETGQVNVIVWKSTRADERQRDILLRAHLLLVDGRWERDEESGGRVCHLIARRFHDLTPLLGRLVESTRIRDLHRFRIHRLGRAADGALRLPRQRRPGNWRRPQSPK